MLVRLLYVSQSVGPITTTVTASILEKSNANNKEQNITGLMPRLRLMDASVGRRKSQSKYSVRSHHG